MCRLYDAGMSLSPCLVTRLLVIATMLLLTQCSTPCAVREIHPVALVPFPNFSHFMLTEEMVSTTKGTDQVVRVPAGFVTDLASIPPSIRSYFEHGGMAYQYPAIVHDWLYWTQAPREQADAIFAKAMQEAEVGWWKRTLIWWGVRMGGKQAWEQNGKERAQGLPKVVPVAYRDHHTWPAHRTWPQFRQELYAKGVRAADEPRPQEHFTPGSFR